MKKLTLLLMGLSLLGCSGTGREWPLEKFDLAKLKQADQTLLVATPMAQQIQAAIKSVVHKVALPGTAELEAHKEQRFLPFRIYLKNKNKGALKTGDVAFNVRFDGAILDLKNYVSSDVRGSFYFYPWIEPVEEEGLESLRVFYLSDATKRTIDGRKFGAGCSRFSEVTKHFTRVMRQGGLETNTTRQRFASVLSGTYVFLRVSPSYYYISSIKVVDSRFPELSCELG